MASDLKTFPVPFKETQGFQDGPDWEHIWNVLCLRRNVIFSMTAIVFALSTIVAFQLRKTYTAETTLLVEKVDESPFSFKELLFAMGESGPTFYETKVGLLKSFPILEMTVEQLDLVKHYQKIFRKLKTKRDAALILKKRVRANLMGRTQIIRVEVRDRDPEMAAKIANAIAENFIKESWRDRLFVSEQLLKWFPNEANALQGGSPINQLQQLDRNEVISSLPSITQDPVIQRLRQDQVKVDSELRELSRRYTEEHPKMKELRGRAEYLQGEMKVQVEKIVMGLKAGLSGEFNVNSLRVVETAVPPQRPSGPKRLLIIIGWTLIAFLFSGWFTILLDHLNRQIRREEDLREFPMTFLGYFPLVAEFEEKHSQASMMSTPPILLDAVHSKMRFMDDLTNIRTSLLFSMPAEQGKLLLCTSASPGEGKTTLSGLMGISLAQTGAKVLLVDADMRNPSLHKVLGIANEEGLSDYLVGSSSGKEIIRQVERYPHLDVITAGKRPPNPAILLGSQAMSGLLAELSQDYEKILFDAPPALHIADAVILAQRMHGAILIFQAGKIHRDAARKLVEKLQMTHGLLVSAVINQVQYHKLDSHYHRYYHEYGKYYHPTENMVKSPVP